MRFRVKENREIGADWNEPLRHHVFGGRADHDVVLVGGRGWDPVTGKKQVTDIAADQVRLDCHAAFIQYQLSGEGGVIVPRSSVSRTGLPRIRAYSAVLFSTFFT